MHLKICVLTQIIHCTFGNLYFELMYKRCTICQNCKKIFIYCCNYMLLLLLKTNRTIFNVFKQNQQLIVLFSSWLFLKVFSRILAAIWMMRFVRLPTLSVLGLSSNIVLRLDLKILSNSNCIKLLCYIRRYSSKIFI